MASETIEDIIRENARLRAALKPILWRDERSVTLHKDCTIAVREAKRIYNESEVK